MNTNQNNNSEITSNFFLNLSKPLQKGLSLLKIQTPTDIQSKVYEPAMEGKNIIGCSPTGTGKTLSYLLPIIQRNQSEGRAVSDLYAVIIVPSKELCIQICSQINQISNQSKLPVTAAALFGGVNKQRQLDTLKSKPNIVVGTYQRIYELIKDRKLPAHQVKTFVLDEADSLLKKDHIDGIIALRKCFMRDVQIMMFSASMKSNHDDTYSLFSQEPFVKIFTNDKITIPTNIHHYYFVVEQRDKIEETRKILKACNAKHCMIFTASKYDSDEITQKLQYHQYKAVCLNSGRDSNSRRQFVDEFRKGHIEHIICSDLAARGMHFDHIDAVINIGLPDKPVDYLHRCGRCGRDGQEALCISIVTEKEMSKIKSIQKTFHINFCAKKLYKGQIVRK